MQQSISITISGKVQGVFFRQSTKEKAIELDIVGSVENLEIGDVFIIATGTKDKIEQLIAWCNRGPSKAKVTIVKTAELPLQVFGKFSILRK